MPDEPFTPTTGVFATDKTVRDWLRKPFKPEQIGKLPATQKRPALDFVGHAAVTDRLNKIAPDWSYEIDNMSTIGDVIWIRMTMTIGGVSRPDFGDGKDPKEALGNALRRCAMRFGVAIDLWSREELEASPAAGPAPSAPTRTAGRAGAATKPPIQDGAGDTSSAGGEAAGQGTGGGSQTSPGATNVTTTQIGCDHKFKTGRWLPTTTKDGIARCPRCGESALIYRETA